METDLTRVVVEEGEVPAGRLRALLPNGEPWPLTCKKCGGEWSGLVGDALAVLADSRPDIDWCMCAR